MKLNIQLLRFVSNIFCFAASDDCPRPNDEIGVCVYPKNCPSLYAIAKKPGRTEAELSHLINSICYYSDTEYKVSEIWYNLFFSQGLNAHYLSIFCKVFFLISRKIKKKLFEIFTNICFGCLKIFEKIKIFSN